MPFFLALDAGGTKTDWVLADETRTLARVRCGSIKRMRVDAETAAARVDETLARLRHETGIDARQVERSCIGTAGNTVPLVADWLRAAFAARVGGRLLLLNDVEIALDAAFPGGAGLLVLAGTGSNVAGRTTEGTVLTAGGWGPALSDQGSGYRIGQQALRAVTLARDEDRQSALMEEILRFWKIESFEELVDHANRVPAPDFSELVQLVVASAERGDAVARQVLQQQAEELAYIVRAIVRRLRVASRDEEFVPRLAFTGSIMEKVAAVRRATVEGVQAEFPGAEELAGVVDPIDGALWRARTGRGFA